MARRHRAHAITRPAGLLNDPRTAAALPTALAALIFAGVWLRVRAWWFIPGRSQFGYPEHVTQRILAGTARAPDQYRILAPRLAGLVVNALGTPLPTALVMIDLAATTALVVVLHLLCARLNARPLILAAALGWAWWSSRLDHWDPNVTLLAVVVTTLALVLTAETSTTCTGIAIVVAGVTLLGLRTDYAAGLGVIVLVAAVRRRSLVLVFTGALVLIAAPAAAVLLARAYPQAQYESAVVQLDYNLTAGSLFAIATFYGPVLLPLLLTLTGRRRVPMWPIVGWFLIELGVTFIVGRPDESRIFMPFIPTLSIAAGLALLPLLRSTSSRHVEPAGPARDEARAGAVRDRAA